MICIKKHETLKYFTQRFNRNKKKSYDKIEIRKKSCSSRQYVLNYIDIICCCYGNDEFSAQRKEQKTELTCVMGSRMFI